MRLEKCSLASFWLSESAILAIEEESTTPTILLLGHHAHCSFPYYGKRQNGGWTCCQQHAATISTAWVIITLT
jgi:hypothetical protein